MFVEDWIYCETTTTGTGNLTLSTKTGWLPFTAYFASGVDGSCDYFEYTIRGSDGIPIESGFGHMSDATTLVRDYVYKTLVAGSLSTANTPATLASGTKAVICADLASSRLRGMMNVRAAATDKLIGDARFFCTTGNAKVLSLNTIFGIAFRSETPALISGAAALINTGAASSNIRIGLYRLNKSREPASLIAATNDIATTTSTTTVTGAWSAGGNRRLPCGDYVLAVKCNGGTPTLFAGSADSRNVSDANWTGGSGSSNTYKYSYCTATSAGSTMPDPFPAASWTGASSDYPIRLYLTPVAF